MSSPGTAVIVVLAILVIAVALLIAAAARRRALQRRFGAENDRVVSQENGRMRAESKLTQRQRRVRKLNIRPLPPAARRRHLAEWHAIQDQFVDSPESAVSDAYTLVTSVMHERGYPTDNEEHALAALSVDHARTVGNFRAAQTIAREAAHGSVATEDMRQALIQYRELIADLLGEPRDGSDAMQAMPGDDGPAERRLGN